MNEEDALTRLLSISEYKHILKRLTVLEAKSVGPLVGDSNQPQEDSNQPKQENYIAKGLKEIFVKDSNQPLTDAVERELAKLPKPPKPEYMKHINDFEDALRKMLHLGYLEYGDGSFGRRPTELSDEIEEEALDICGWGFILWVRLRELRNKLAREEGI